MSGEEELVRLLAAAGIEAGLASKLAHYGALVLAENRRFNVTGAKSAGAFAPHVIDSLSIVPFIEGDLVDVGSGAGLPAIPVAIASGVHVTMVEATVKKARFLESMLTEFGVSGRVVAERAEIAARNNELRDQFSCATARAVSRAPTVAELLLPFLKPGGVALLQRGAMEPNERNALADASSMLAARVEKTVALDASREIIVVRKMGPTPQRFPRRTGIPEKRPLCL